LIVNEDLKKILFKLFPASVAVKLLMALIFVCNLGAKTLTKAVCCAKAVIAE
jgi:hypothetical protein